MSKLSHDLQNLARRARCGDQAAGRILHETLRSAVVHIVRQTLRTGRCFHSLGRHILAEARGMAPHADPTEAWERLCHPITQRVCDRILSHVMAGAAGGERWLDTVCN